MQQNIASCRELHVHTTLHRERQFQYSFYTMNLLNLWRAMMQVVVVRHCAAELWLHSFFIPALCWCWCPAPCSGRFTSEKEPSAHSARGLEDPRAGLDECKNIAYLATPGFEPRTFKSVASYYTDYELIKPQGIIIIIIIMVVLLTIAET